MWGPDEPVTLRPGEVFTHSFINRTWLGSHCPAETETTAVFVPLTKGGIKMHPPAPPQHPPPPQPTPPPLTRSMCGCVWWAVGWAALWVGAASSPSPTPDCPPAGRGRTAAGGSGGRSMAARRALLLQRHRGLTSWLLPLVGGVGGRGLRCSRSFWSFTAAHTPCMAACMWVWVWVGGEVRAEALGKVEKHAATTDGKRGFVKDLLCGWTHFFFF